MVGYVSDPIRKNARTRDLKILSNLPALPENGFKNYTKTVVSRFTGFANAVMGRHHEKQSSFLDME